MWARSQIPLQAVITTSDQAEVRVQYTGAEEWYTLTGSPIPLADRTAMQVHTAVLKAAKAGHEGGVSADQVS